MVPNKFSNVQFLALVDDHFRVNLLWVTFPWFSYCAYDIVSLSKTQQIFNGLSHIFQGFHFAPTCPCSCVTTKYATVKLLRVKPHFIKFKHPRPMLALDITVSHNFYRAQIMEIIDLVVPVYLSEPTFGVRRPILWWISQRRHKKDTSISMILDYILT